MWFSGKNPWYRATRTYRSWFLGYNLRGRKETLWLVSPKNHFNWSLVNEINIWIGKHKHNWSKQITGRKPFWLFWKVNDTILMCFCLLAKTKRLNTHNHLDEKSNPSSTSEMYILFVLKKSTQRITNFLGLI